MARVTVEDCLDHCENRFALVILASRRARQLMTSEGAVTVSSKNKPAVTALREIASGSVNFDRSVTDLLRDGIR